MKNLLNPKWILIVNTLPILVLFSIFIGEYKIIKSLLTEESIHAWILFGLLLAGLFTINLCYTIFLIWKRKDVSVYYGLTALPVYITFIYQYCQHFDLLIPPSIPRWMLEDEGILYIGTFLMPTFIYAVCIIMVWLTPDSKDHKVWKNIAAALAVPLLFYGFFQLILPLWKRVESTYADNVLIILFITGTLIFLFFIVRTMFIIATKKAHVWKKYQLAWKIPLSVVLPVTGLAVNGLAYDGVFGDFGHHWFYILAV
ncbi:MAG: MSEP-CTERM sorting domain-containing protein, partial [Cytophagales bacterium]|nr:MSEP-CTERM sorting domain-containing protein [Cytophaga sp.]